MRGIYIIVITFLVFLTDNEITAKEARAKRSMWKESVEPYEDGIPTKCPYPEKDNKTTTNLPHETDCTKFYKCDVGQGNLLECPLAEEAPDNTRLHYNRQEQVCDWPWRAGCIYCPLPDKNGVWPLSKLPHETDNCRLYYVCINGVKHLEYCPPNTCFSRTCQTCVVNRSRGNCDY